MDFLVNPPASRWPGLIGEGSKAIFVADDDTDRAAIAAQLLNAPDGALLIVTDAMIGLEVAGEIHAALTTPAPLSSLSIVTISDPSARREFLSLARGA